MKIKKIAGVLALIILAATGTAWAGQGENVLEYHLNANVTKATPGGDVRVKIYKHFNEVPKLDLLLAEGLDFVSGIGDVLTWGTDGIGVQGGGFFPRVAPENIYEIELYSDNNNIAYKAMSVKCFPITLQKAGDTQHVLDGVCGRPYDDVNVNSTAYVGPKNQIPQALQDFASKDETFQSFPAEDHVNYTNSKTPQPGDALYFPIAFYAYLPGMGNDISNYEPGLYTGSGAVIIAARW